ncbi:LCCL domain-containing protein [Bradyrhizobium prioriisuperbiae]|uniref:LCCL domain-containing protein n=1 Tax=Bradyrhizobium prioriisuperbiae TaxID=2854389 RepID=UPI0028E3BA2E|nr:LCCL domain-containing protein [Bradyrhizobium prioritasuperba]
MKLQAVIAVLGVVAAGAAQAQGNDQAAGQRTVSVCPSTFKAYAGTSEPLTCSCTREQIDINQYSFPTYGNDVYTSDSSLCRAAVHAGAADARTGGTVTIVPEAGRKAYAGAIRNGIQSLDAGAHDASFRFATGSAAGQSAGTSAATPAASVSVCPSTFKAYAGSGEPLTCSCGREQIDINQYTFPTYGNDVYTSDSSLCRAAVHAGAANARTGGTVTIVPEAGRKAYAGAIRNGIESLDANEHEASFRFAMAPAPAANPGRDAAPTAPAASTSAAASICPSTFKAYAGTSEPLTCSCTGEQININQYSFPTYGNDVYTSDSSLCRAAVHAGAASAKTGGTVTIIPEAGRKVYAGAVRNGIESLDAGAHDASFRFAVARTPPPQAPAPPVAVVAGKPVQQPIAATIEATGQVALYIQFRFNSADLDVSASPTLNELRDALSATPNLRLLLVGHTDAIGTPDYNQTLSWRRAQAVMNWLTAQGIAQTRLGIDGKGQSQPVADNATDAGRALNRRVQAIRVP